MKRSESQITTRGRTTVPQELRERLGLAAGMRLDWQALDSGRLIVHVNPNLGPHEHANFRWRHAEP